MGPVTNKFSVHTTWTQATTTMVLLQHCQSDLTKLQSCLQLAGSGALPLSASQHGAAAKKYPEIFLIFNARHV